MTGGEVLRVGGVWQPVGGGGGSITGPVDALGRTQILGSSSIPTPALRNVVSVMDAPFSAKGDGRRVTDGAITNGQATLSSASAAFTTAHIGQVVSVAGAGTQGTNQNSPLTATIRSVTGGVATLSASASTTVSGAIVHFGTDDTTSIQNAANALSAVGGGVLLLPQGRAHLVGSIIPPSNVIFWGYGCTLLKNGADTNAIFSNTSFSPLSVISNIGFYGITCQGLGLYSGLYNWPTAYDHHAGINLYSVQNVNVVDCTVDGMGNAGIQFDQAQNVKIQRNTVTNCGALHLGNGISVNVYIAGTQTGTNILSNDVEISGNTVTGCATGCIVLGNGWDTSTQPFNARIHDNYCQVGDANGNGWTCIGLELGGFTVSYVNHSIQQVTVHDNICVSTVTTGTIANEPAIAVIQDGVSTNPTDALAGIAYVHLHHNTINSTAGGINFQGSYSHIDHNIVRAVYNGINVTNNDPVAGTGTQVDHNTIILGTGPTNHGIVANNVDRIAIENNKIFFASTTTSACHGIFLDTCTKPEITGNRVEYAPHSGIYLYNAVDARVCANRIYNPSAAGTNQYGIFLDTCTAVQRTMIHDNDILDDRGTHLMLAGISNSAGNPRLDVKDNAVYGTTGASLTFGTAVTFFGPNATLTTNQSGDMTTISVTASPFVYTNGLAFPVTVGVVGGTVSAITRTRSAVTKTIGVTSGEFHLEIGEVLTVTYSVAPTMYYSPKNQR